MRYQPLDALKRNSYVGENWTNDLLTKYMRYFSNINKVGGLSFLEWIKFEKTERVESEQMDFMET